MSTSSHPPGGPSLSISSNEDFEKNHDEKNHKTALNKMLTEIIFLNQILSKTIKERIDSIPTDAAIHSILVTAVQSNDSLPNELSASIKSYRKIYRQYRDQYGNSLLHWAVLINSLPLLKICVYIGLSMEAEGICRLPVSHLAIFCGDTKIIKYFISQGCRVHTMHIQVASTNNVKQNIEIEIDIFHQSIITGNEKAFELVSTELEQSRKMEFHQFNVGYLAIYFDRINIFKIIKSTFPECIKIWVPKNLLDYANALGRVGYDLVLQDMM